jgi:hypothetical protein
MWNTIAIQTLGNRASKAKQHSEKITVLENITTTWVYLDWQQEFRILSGNIEFTNISGLGGGVSNKRHNITSS